MDVAWAEVYRVALGLLPRKMLSSANQARTNTKRGIRRQAGRTPKWASAGVQNVKH
jgi:hypothetical protein